ncbi:MAG: hypothetical protein ACOZDY_07750 [Pseudomonadota bacterium]
MKARRSIMAATVALLAATALGLPAAAHADGGWKKHDRHHHRYEQRHHGKHWGPPGYAQHHWKHGYSHRYYGPPRVVYQPYPVYRYAPKPHYGYGYRDGITIIYRGHF